MTTSTEIPNLPETKLWTERVGAFAKTLGLTIETVNEKLKPLIGDPSDDNVATLADPDCTSDDDLVAAFSDVPKAKVKRAAKEFRTAAAPPVAVQASMAAPAVSAMLPTLPDDDSFLAALRVGGTPKVSGTEVSAAVRIFVAHQSGLSDLPKRILAMLEQRAEEMDEPIGEEFVEVRRAVLEQRYGDIMEAVGLKGHSVTVEQRRKLIEKMGALPTMLRDFQQVVSGWCEEWMAQVSNPAMFMQTMAAAMGGGSGLLGGMTAPPDAGTVLAAAEGVINGFNRMFSGYGRATARAMGYDAVKVKQVLADPRLPVSIGAASREEMLKRLGVGVSSDLVRLEADMGRYVLAIYQIGESKVATDQLPVYLTAVANLGKQINWDRLSGTNGTRPTTSAGRSTSGGPATGTGGHRTY
jgi:hypothetical protein